MTNFKELPYVAKIGIVAGVILLIGVGTYLFALRPLAKANQADALTLKSKQAEVAQLAPYRTKLAELNAQTEALKIQMEAQRRIVPEEKEVPSFITMIENEANVAGVEVRRYTPKDTSTKDYYVEVPFEIDVDGPYYSVLNFYERLQKADRIVNVGRLSMGALKGGKMPAKKTYHWSPNETVSASCLLTTFYSNPNGKAPSTAVAAKK
ncbi:MAG TPA: type 4a pilus biogenesis protein PilO [Candidatus Saccharimonadales bacterium]|nr:type 4a pilus biogenesis protein PilO [Candidatus Saccharimonadales bacterium]